MNNIKMKFIKLIFLLSIIWISNIKTVAQDMNDSQFYFGKSNHSLIVYQFFVQQGDTKADIEIYFRFKGMYLFLDKFSLPVSEVSQIYENDNYILTLKDKKAFLNCKQLECVFFSKRHTIYGSTRLSTVTLKLDPEAAGKLEFFRNRTYIDDDYTNKWLATLGHTDLDDCESSYEKLLYQYGAYNLASQLTHKEFVIEFEKIKSEVLSEIEICIKHKETDK